ncbi:response regulator transcription factor [Dehalococcoides mccartyi]|uniref:response regulator transcription factor n=1 Tax=Dehalococcoides mccartyi TaxID=61435 RepID=UPI001640FEC5|nr:response regulator transcription factor [Dehalococcoides mccartyi]
MIEDDNKIIDSLRLLIKTFDKDAQILCADSGKTAAKILDREPLNLVILDLGLPDISGMSVLKTIKQRIPVPVIILTVQESEQTILEAFELEVDDYIIKPFKPLEFIARMKAVLRRNEPAKQKDLSISYGKWHFGRSICDLQFGDQKICLTITEGRILYGLINNQGSILNYDDFSKIIWGSKEFYSQGTLKVYINRIRKKLESLKTNHQLVINAPGIGYYIAAE